MKKEKKIWLDAANEVKTLSEEEVKNAMCLLANKLTFEEIKLVLGIMFDFERTHRKLVDDMETN